MAPKYNHVDDFNFGHRVHFGNTAHTTKETVKEALMLRTRKRSRSSGGLRDKGYTKLTEEAQPGSPRREINQKLLRINGRWLLHVYFESCPPPRIYVRSESQKASINLTGRALGVVHKFDVTHLVTKTNGKTQLRVHISNKKE